MLEICRATACKRRLGADFDGHPSSLGGVQDGAVGASDRAASGLLAGIAFLDLTQLRLADDVVGRAFSPGLGQRHAVGRVINGCVPATQI